MISQANAHRQESLIGFASTMGELHPHMVDVHINSPPRLSAQFGIAGISTPVTLVKSRNSLQFCLILEQE
jgi:hypothetical protein